MKRREFLKAAGVGVAASTAVAAPAIAQSMPVIKWRMPCSWPKSLDTIYGGADMMAKAVAKPPTTNSRSRSSPPARSCRACRSSTPCRPAPSRSATPRPTTISARTRPLLSAPRCRSVRTRASTRAGARIGGGKEVLNEFYKKYNGVALLAGNTGCQMGGWFRKEINTVDDLKGLKMRIGGFAGRVLQKLGVVPQQIAGGDIYPALEKGTHRRRRMGRSLRRREARLLQGRAALLLPGLVGRRLDAVRLRQPRQVERAAEALSGDARAGRPLRQHLDDGEVR